MTDKPQLTGQGSPDPEPASRPKDIADLDARLRQARKGGNGAGYGEQGDAPSPDSARGRGFGLAMRLSTDLVAGVVVGGGFGWLIDKWAGSWPWGFVVFFFLGAGAGLNLAYKSALKIGRELERDSGSNDQRSG